MQLEPDCIYSIFIKIKVLLVKSAANETVDELQRMLACEEFNLDFLRVGAPLLPDSKPVNKRCMLDMRVLVWFCVAGRVHRGHGREGCSGSKRGAAVLV